MGGTYLRFTVGSRGASAAHVAYISRFGAVRDTQGRCGFVSQAMPAEVERAATFEEAREAAVAFAYVRERVDVKGRSHYRTVISFERKMETERASSLVGEWMREAFPEARGMAFVHQNTEHTHAHVWLDARKPGGRKLHLSRDEYRRLDEIWNRIYCREMGRDEREHLTKKGSHERSRDTESGRQAREATTAHRAGRTSAGERTVADSVRADERALWAVAHLHRVAQELDREPERQRREEPERERSRTGERER